jgi:hypothetical protein
MAAEQQDAAVEAGASHGASLLILVGADRSNYREGMMDSFHVGVAAEAFAAGLFAQAGCDVLVQYGANQPEYDFVATRQDRTLKVSVKGSQDGGWGLIQNYKAQDVTYHEAADRWAARQSPTIIYCLVQFQDIELGQCPRVYLATVREIADWHKASRNGLGGTILWESHAYKSGAAANCKDCIPEEWRFSEMRLDAVLGLPNNALQLTKPAQAMELRS